MKKKIVVIGAHYDDVEIGCGGTLLKYSKKGHKIYIAITSSDEFRSGDVQKRYIEQQRSLRLMDAEYLKTFKIEDSIHNIISSIDKIEPDIVFTQCENDTHQDHKRASMIGQAVGRKRHVTTLLYDSGSSYDFHPNVFSLIDWEKKLELLHCFKTQIEHEAIRLDILQKKDAFWASLITDDPEAHAEGFIARKLKWQV